MNDAQVTEILTEIFRDVFMKDDIVLVNAMTAKDISGWDSFKQIDIVMATEERFDVAFSSQEIDGLGSVGDLVRLVVAKKARLS